MKRILIALAGLTAATAASGAGPQRTAWFMKTTDGKQWCAFTNEAKARQSGDSERFDGAETAYIEYQAEAIQALEFTQASQDSIVQDRFTLDANGRAIKVTRTGQYVEREPISVIYMAGKDGKLQLTAASQAIVKKEIRAGRETYFLDWSLYAGLGQMPFKGLIQTKPAISVTERCVSAPR